MQILLVFFLQGLQGLALNLAHILQKMKLLLQDLKIFARVLQEKIVNNFLARFDQSLARKLCYNFLQDFSYLTRKASILVQDLQDIVQDLASFARKILARLGYSCKLFFT